MYHCNMKIWTVLLLSALFFTACQGEKKDTAIGSQAAFGTTDSLTVQEFDPYQWDTLCGIYSGIYSDREININLTYVSQYNAVGYSVLNGLIRNISGKVTQTADSVKLVLSELGDHAHDGVFQLNINKQNFNVKGSWKAYNSSIPSKTFQLKKKQPLDYNEFDYDKPVTAENFLFFYGVSEDSLGYYYFHEDGSVNYEFYTTTNAFSNQEGTMQYAQGSWTIKGGDVIIYWQPNFAFPNLKSKFRIMDNRKTDPENGYPHLQGEGRIIYPQYEGY